MSNSVFTFKPSKEKLLPFQKRFSKRETTVRKWTFVRNADESTATDKRRSVSRLNSSTLSAFNSQNTLPPVLDGLPLPSSTPEGSEAGSDSNISTFNPSSHSTKIDNETTSDATLQPRTRQRKQSEENVDETSSETQTTSSDSKQISTQQQRMMSFGNLTSTESTTSSLESPRRSSRLEALTTKNVKNDSPLKKVKISQSVRDDEIPDDSLRKVSNTTPRKSHINISKSRLESQTLASSIANKTKATSDNDVVSEYESEDARGERMVTVVSQKKTRNQPSSRRRSSRLSTIHKITGSTETETESDDLTDSNDNATDVMSHTSPEKKATNAANLSPKNKFQKNMLQDIDGENLKDSKLLSRERTINATPQKSAQQARKSSPRKRVSIAENPVENAYDNVSENHMQCLDSEDTYSDHRPQISDQASTESESNLKTSENNSKSVEEDSVTSGSIIEKVNKSKENIFDSSQFTQSDDEQVTSKTSEVFQRESESRQSPSPLSLEKQRLSKSNRTPVPNDMDEQEIDLHLSNSLRSNESETRKSMSPSPKKQKISSESATRKSLSHSPKKQKLSKARNETDLNANNSSQSDQSESETRKMMYASATKKQRQLKLGKTSFLKEGTALQGNKSSERDETESRKSKSPSPVKRKTSQPLNSVSKNASRIETCSQVKKLRNQKKGSTSEGNEIDIGDSEKIDLDEFSKHNTESDDNQEIQNDKTDEETEETRGDIGPEDRHEGNIEDGLLHIRRNKTLSSRKRAAEQNEEQPVGADSVRLETILVSSETPHRKQQKKNVVKKKVTIVTEENTSMGHDQTINMWRGEDRHRTNKDVIDLDVVLDCVTSTLEQQRRSCTTQLGKKAINSLLMYTRKDITDVINKIEELKAEKRDLMGSRKDVKFYREKLIELQIERKSLTKQIKVQKDEEKKQLRNLNQWLHSMSKLMQVNKQVKSPRKVEYQSYGSFPIDISFS